MRRFLWGFVVLVATATAADAQDGSPSSPRPRFDLNFTIGGFTAEVEPSDFDIYGDDWYSEGRYAVAFGYYWTRSFKTEIEFAHTGEGSTYLQELVRVPGTTVMQPVAVQQYHRIQQTSVRAVWEFLPNTWIQPYVNIGGVLEADRRHSFSPQAYYYPPQVPGSFTPSVPVRPATQTGPEMEYRGGVTVGGGSKFYVSTNAYINTGLQLTYAKPTSSVSFLGGFGFDF